MLLLLPINNVAQFQSVPRVELDGELRSTALKSVLLLLVSGLEHSFMY